MISDALRPVRQSLVRASGYGDPEASLRNAIAPLKVGVGPRRIKVIEDVIIVPGGGILGPGGETLRDGRVRQGRAGDNHFGAAPIEPVTPVSTIPGDALYLGWAFFHHFGHFLVDSMVRYWAVDRVPRDIPLLWISTPGFRNRDLVRTQGAAFGVDPARMQLILEPTRVRRLLVPETTFEERAYIHAEAAEPFHALGRSLAGDTVETDQPLYLSRAGIEAPRRHFAHEALFEEFLRGQGWRVIRPETLSGPEQLRAIRSHRVIAGHRGSAFHLTMFSEQRPSLHLFMCGPLQTSYILWAVVLEAPSSFFRCARLANKPDEGPAGPGEFDMAAAAAYLRAEGLIGNAAPPVPPASPGRPLEERVT